MLSRRSGTASYSWACSRNASGFSSDSCAPPASFISARREASTSCPASSPARSQDSSDLRNHSSRPQMMAPQAEGRSAGRRSAPPAGSGSAAWCGRPRARTGCGRARARPPHRSSSGSYRLTMPVVITMNGLSRPSAIAFTSGVLDDVALGHLGQVQDVGTVPDQLVDVRELALGDADGAREVGKPEGPLVEQAEQLAQKRVEPAELAQRDQRRAVGGMLVGAGRDAGEPDSRAIRH